MGHLDLIGSQADSQLNDCHRHHHETARSIARLASNTAIFSSLSFCLLFSIDWGLSSFRFLQRTPSWSNPIWATTDGLLSAPENNQKSPINRRFFLMSFYFLLTCFSFFSSGSFISFSFDFIGFFFPSFSFISGAGSGTVGGIVVGGEEVPVFLEPVNNATVVIGRDASLTCVVDNIGANKVDNSFPFPFPVSLIGFPSLISSIRFFLSYFPYIFICDVWNDLTHQQNQTRHFVSHQRASRSPSKLLLDNSSPTRPTLFLIDFLFSSIFYFFYDSFFLRCVLGISLYWSMRN